MDAYLTWWLNRVRALLCLLAVLVVVFFQDELRLNRFWGILVVGWIALFFRGLLQTQKEPTMMSALYHLFWSFEGSLVIGLLHLAGLLSLSVLSAIPLLFLGLCVPPVLLLVVDRH